MVLMRRLIDCVLIQHDHRGTNVLLRHPVDSPAPDRRPDPAFGSADRATGTHARDVRGSSVDRSAARPSPATSLSTDPRCTRVRRRCLLSG